MEERGRGEGCTGFVGGREENIEELHKERLTRRDEDEMGSGIGERKFLME